MSLLMKWAEQACFSQNHISNLVSVCAGLYPTIEDGLQCFFTQGIPVEGISFCVGRAVVNSSVRSELQRVNSQLTSEFDPVN